MQTKRLMPADLVFGLASLAVVASISLVHIAKHRHAARGTSCVNNLKNLALATHNYHSAFKQLPMGAGGTSAQDDAADWQNNDDRISAFVALLPFYEQQPLWEQIVNPFAAGGKTFPPMGPLPTYDAEVYTPWKQRPTLLVCTSEPDHERFPLASSYTVNYGDGIDQVGTSLPDRPALQVIGRASKRGMFQRKQVLRFRDILDGLSNTVMYSESKMGGDQVAKNVARLVLNPSLSIDEHADAGAQFWPEGRGAVWADGRLLSTGFQTILPPNSPSCTSDNGELEGVLVPSSYHDQGVHVCFADGATKLISNGIDAGDSRSPSVAFARAGTRGAAPPGSKSPYGLWGALGTRASREIVDDDDPAIMPPQQELSASRMKAAQARPVQVWTAVDGTSQLAARQIGLSKQGRVLLLTEQGKQRYVPLSLLQSEDAYRAVEQHLGEKIAAEKELKKQLQRGIELLEKRDYETFATEFVSLDSDREAAVLFVKQQRGMLIQVLDVSLADMARTKRGVIRIEVNDGGKVNAAVDVSGIVNAFDNFRIRFYDEKIRVTSR